MSSELYDQTSTSDHPGLFGRVGKWFKRGQGGEDDAELPRREGTIDRFEPVKAPKASFLRPWAKRDAAIANVQRGLLTLNELMGAIRDNLERTGERQDELLRYLAHLPGALETLPENNRVQSETLKAIHQQLATQNAYQTRLTDILERLSEVGSEQRENLDFLKDRVETITQHDQVISENLSGVSLAMQSVSRTTQTSAQVLSQMQENIGSRDRDLEEILRKQNRRFTVMLSVVIGVLVVAVAMVGVFGYLLLTR